MFYKLEQKKSSNAKTIQGDIYSIPQKVGHNTKKGNNDFTKGRPVGCPTKVV